jgi:predicted transcriptional regulator
MEVTIMKQVQKISDSEMEIMEIIWGAGGTASSTLISEKLSGTKAWKHSTVLTFLIRLVEKGVLSITKNGKVNTYSALISKEDYIKLQTQSFLQTFHGGRIKSFITTLLDSDDISQEDIDELKKWFADR